MKKLKRNNQLIKMKLKKMNSKKRKSKMRKFQKKNEISLDDNSNESERELNLLKRKTEKNKTEEIGFFNSKR